jgi:hypothetical protein
MLRSLRAVCKGGFISGRCYTRVVPWRRIIQNPNFRVRAAAAPSAGAPAAIEAARAPFLPLAFLLAVGLIVPTTARSQQFVTDDTTIVDLDTALVPLSDISLKSVDDFQEGCRSHGNVLERRSTAGYPHTTPSDDGTGDMNATSATRLLLAKQAERANRHGAWRALRRGVRRGRDHRRA